MIPAQGSRRAIVTGAAGFIGSHLCERLVADGWHVVGIDAFTDYYARADKEANLRALAREPRFALLETDLLGASWRSALRPYDTVFHLAAQPGVRGSFGASFARYARDNVVATQRVFEAAVEAACRRIVWASSSSIYGDALEYPCTEASLARPQSPYGVTKKACEDLARIYAQRGTCLVGLRYFTVYGPRQRPDMALRRLCEAATTREPFRLWGDGSQSRDFTFVTDACDATLRAAEARDPAPVYNVGGGSEATLGSVIDILESLTDVPLDIRCDPPQPGDVHRTAADTSAARQQLGWRPSVDLATGLRAELSWVQAAHGAQRVA
jgi:nucleoside-diphosphate-sugar epimerase